MGFFRLGQPPPYCCKNAAPHSPFLGLVGYIDAETPNMSNAMDKNAKSIKQICPIDVTNLSNPKDKSVQPIPYINLYIIYI